MKKSILVTLLSALLLTTVSFGAAADEAKKEREYKYPFVESKVSYRQVTVYKVLDHKDGYVIMHQKGHRDVGSVVVPKKWYKEQPAKLRFRPLQPGMSPYMTVFYKEGNFDHVVLTVPSSRLDSTWGIADSSYQIDANKDSFDIVY